MSFLEDLFDGRKHGYRDGHGGHGGHDGDHHDDHYRAPKSPPQYGPGRPGGAGDGHVRQCRAPVVSCRAIRFCRTAAGRSP